MERFTDYQGCKENNIKNEAVSKASNAVIPSVTKDIKVAYGINIKILRSAANDIES